MIQPLLIAWPGDCARVKRIAERIDAEWVEPEVRSFPDGESYVRIEADVAGRDVAVVGSLHRPDPKFLRLRFLADTARDVGASAVGLLAPYLPYMRQDARFRPGEGVTSRYFADLISASFDWLVCVEPHLHRHAGLDGLYSLPTRTVEATEPIARWIDDHVDSPVLIGPDEEARQWVAAVAERGDYPMVVLEKVRHGAYDVEIESVDDDAVADGTPVIIDDIISTGRTMVEAVEQVRQRNDAAPVCIGIHGLFADDARSALEDAGVGRVVTCNTVDDETNAIDVTEPLVEGIVDMMSRDASATVVPGPGRR